MKNVILSADGDRMVYSVPDEVSINLKSYCFNFEKWIKTTPEGQKYYIKKYGVFAFDQSDFIEWLNKYKFPKEPSFFVENLGNIYSTKDLPEHYRKCKRFNF